MSSLYRSRHILWLYWLACFLLTHMPLPDVPGEPLIPHLDKVVHFTMYGMLAALLALRYGGRKVAMLIAAYAIFDEVSQPYFGRTFDLLDLTADFAGATLGATLSFKARK